MTFVLTNWKGEVYTAEMALYIAESILNSFLGEEKVSSQKPFSINLVDSEIWVVGGARHQPKDSIIMGKAAYVEIQKSNGEISKIILGE